MNPPSAVIFDFDGTIADTETLYEAARIAHEEHGLELPMATWIQVVGTAYNKPLAERLRDELGRPGCRRDGPGRGTAPPRPRERPGAAGRGGSDHGRRRTTRRLAIASSSPIDWVEPHLTRLGSSTTSITPARVIRSTEANPPLICSSSPPDWGSTRPNPRHRGLATRLRGSPSGGDALWVVPNAITAHDVHPDAEIVLESLVDFLAHFGF